MTARGFKLALQRALTLALLFAACLAAARVSMLAGGALVAMALVVYAFFPVRVPPTDALTYDRGPAVVGPDLISFMAVPPFAAIPFWAEPDWPMAGGALHPSAMLAWPVALFFLIFTGIGWHYASRTITITEATLDIDTGRRHLSVPFADITEVTPWRRGLPGWVRALAPVALALGRPGAAGAIMIARDSNGIRLGRKGGPPFVIASDAFDKGTRAILAACQRHGVRVRGLADFLD